MRIVCLVLLVATTAAAQPANRAHPRLWLSESVVAALKARAQVPGSQVARAVTRCDDAVANPALMRNTDGGYQGLGFASLLGACAVAWKVTDKPEHLAAAVRYFRALIEDYQTIGDGNGGDRAVTTDSGFAMRAFAPYAAIGYDWLHAHLDADLRADARARFKAWTDWYPENGYRASSPGTNYHAGYLFGATLIGIAEAGEAGADGDALWATVTNTIWAEMAAALAPGQVLDGGDWLEGWQYGPLAVAEYALAARALRENGVAGDAWLGWVGSLLVRWRHALSPPGTHSFIGGDYQQPDVNRPASHLVLYAILAGTHDETTRGHASSELARLPADSGDFYLIAALAEASLATPVAFPTDAPTWYQAAGARTFFARTSWATDAGWLVAQCSPQRDVDHQPPNAGNFVLSRGDDDLVVDPSPYGSLSSLTSNAPTAPSDVLPDGYSPSQAAWGGDAVGFAWARQTVSGVAVARCDYANQFAFRDEAASDVAHASRDFVMLPSPTGTTLVVVDRLATGDADRPLMLRFRTPGDLTLDGQVARLARGDSALFVRTLAGGTPATRDMPVGNCFAAGITRGGCDRARFAGDEVRLEVPGPQSVAVHVLDATGTSASAPAAELIESGGLRLVRVVRGSVTTTIAAAAQPSTGGGAPVEVTVPAPSQLVFLDAPRGPTGRTDATAISDPGGCKVTLTARSGDGGFDGRPLVVAVNADCTLVEAASQPGAEPPLPTPTPDGGMPGVDPTPDETEEGCGCSVGGREAMTAWPLLLLSLLLLCRRRPRNN